MAKAVESEHAIFIFHWIAFNCMYGVPPDKGESEKKYAGQMKDIRKFTERIKEMRILDCLDKTPFFDDVIEQCRPYAKALIADEFLNKKYWEKPALPLHSIKNECNDEWERASKELSENDNPHAVLVLSFERLLLLRNQIVHGCATSSSQSMGIKSLRSGKAFLENMVPALYSLVKKYGYLYEWGPPPYPRKGHPEHPKHPE